VECGRVGAFFPSIRNCIAVRVGVVFFAAVGDVNGPFCCGWEHSTAHFVVLLLVWLGSVLACFVGV